MGEGGGDEWIDTEPIKEAVKHINHINQPNPPEITSLFLTTFHKENIWIE